MQNKSGVEPTHDMIVRHFAEEIGLGDLVNKHTR